MNNLIYSKGWLKDYPDLRDYTIDTDSISQKRALLGQTDSVKGMVAKLKIAHTKKSQIKELPAKVDLSKYCSPVEDQGSLGSCTANAAAGIIEYYEKRAFGTHLNVSRLFTYKTTRSLMGWKGDTGAYLRTTMASLSMFGAALEKYWPYVISHFEDEPPAFVYAIAQNYQAVSYYRLDKPGATQAELLSSIKAHLNAGIPSMFGFTCYTSLALAQDGRIPFPQPNEKTDGGHAVAAVGYDDNIVIGNGKNKTKGALLIRNSWGTGWGEKGYGYLPYEYVLQKQADDFWVVLKNEWVNTGNFGL